jgi:hypothetical protein
MEVEAREGRTESDRDIPVENYPPTKRRKAIEDKAEQSIVETFELDEDMLGSLEEFNEQESERPSKDWNTSDTKALNEIGFEEPSIGKHLEKESLCV